MSNRFRVACILAKAAHCRQVDKAGEPYYNHIARVAERVKCEEDKTVAMLHDIVEDSPITLEDLRDMGFGPTIVHAVDILTRRDNEMYFQYIDRIIQSGNIIARNVKLADLTDNQRNAYLLDHSLIERYKKAIKLINESMPG